MAPIRNAVHIPGADYFSMKSGKITAEELFGKMQKAAGGMIEQLLWWTRALKNARK